MASSARSPPAGVSPAQLGFLAIFNPSLGPTDETLDDQIVYYASLSTQPSTPKRRRTRSRPTDSLSQEERHERLRQIGLAQGMAHFSRGFADGAAVDTIETEKSRVVLHELEPGWWILASIDFARIPLPPRLPTKSDEGQEDKFDYSSREMKPVGLILQDLLHAHSLFLMHHDTSLSALFVRSKRAKFVALLSRYWDLFLSTWNVLLHGNPARDVFGGINIAASGELGTGVGEEDRGSGEREVFEGLVGRIEGLVDLVVSKFGSPSLVPDKVESDGTHEEQPWLGTGREPGAEDGAIFLGTGALSRKSIRDITHWMEDLYTWGEHAYGVIDSPTSVRRHRKKHGESSSRKPDSGSAQPGQGNAATATAAEATVGTADQPSPPKGDGRGGEQSLEDAEEGRLDKMVSYLKLGYGSYWSLPGASGESTAERAGTPAREGPASRNQSSSPRRPELRNRQSSFETAGHFLIGLRGDIEEAESEHELSDDSGDAQADRNSRTVLRTVNVELESEAVDRPEATIVRDFEHPASILTQSQVVGNMVPGYESHDLNKAKKLRVVVYVNNPFIFTFLFHLRTDSLAWDTLYRSLHYQLNPLKKSMLVSTSYRPERPNGGPAASSIDDLVWDPLNLTVHSTIPNIPEQQDSAADGWSRADAINTHLHLLSIHSATRPHTTELELTEKTTRGWWIVWTRLIEGKAGGPGPLSTIRESSPDSAGHTEDSEADDATSDLCKEVFLIRRASDHARFRSVGGSMGESSADAAGKLVQGIGVDTRRYIEELISLL